MKDKPTNRSDKGFMMHRFNRRTFVASTAAAVAISAPVVRADEATPVATPVSGGLQARLLDFEILPNELIVDDTLFGGISGIDYDPAADTWYFISDDPSHINPARFYIGAIEYDDNGFTDVSIERAVTLLQGDGTPFSSWEEGGIVADPEAIRKDPLGESLWWTSEGARELGVDPSVAISNPDGTLTTMMSFPPPYATDYPEEIGPRGNHSFEGLSFSTDGETLWIGMEHPLYQDGPIPSPDNNAWVRLVHLDRAGKILHEYALELDPIEAPDDAQYASRGMSEILMLDESRLLAVVRTTIADSDGEYENYIRLWEFDVADATDIHGIESLVDAEFTPAARRLVIDLNEAGLYPIDNIEAMAFGPNLPNGNRALVLANDNNFDFETQVQQVVLLEVTGE